MPSLKNQKDLKELESILKEKPNLVITTYSGLSVEEITELRKKLKQKNVVLKVVKNNLFKIALKNSQNHKFEENTYTKEVFYGPIAVTFSGEEMPAVAKILLDESKKNEKIKIKGGYYEGKFLNAAEVKDISGLPTKEELLAIIARGLNTPAQKIAIGINEIITKLARGIKAVAEKNNLK